jgi:hypothetical protein
VTGLLALASLAALVGLAPGPDSVQQAYDAAKVETGVKHQDDLKIREAQCSALAGARYACQIDFVRTAEPRGRLYFTVVTIEKQGQAWTLLGGLCKRRSG